LIGWLNVSDFVPQQLDSPKLSLLCEVLNNFLIDFVTFLESFIKCKFSNLTSHGSLSKIDDGLLVILHIISGSLRVSHLNVDNSINLNKYVIFCDTGLWGNLDDLLSEIVNICDLVNEWNLEVPAGFELVRELFEAVEHDSIFLADDNADTVIIAATCVTL